MLCTTGWKPRNNKIKCLGMAPKCYMCRYTNVHILWGNHRDWWHRDDLVVRWRQMQMRWSLHIFCFMFGFRRCRCVKGGYGGTQSGLCVNADFEWLIYVISFVVVVFVQWPRRHRFTKPYFWLDMYIVDTKCVLLAFMAAFKKCFMFDI